MLNPHLLAPNLLNIIDKLEKNRRKIASQWIETPTVKSVFKAQKISTVKFKDGYGVPIIEYFISVVREEKEAGNCPVMSKLVGFLLEKNITPKDVFDICMGLRRTLVLYLFKNKLIEDNATEMMEEIATLFDANLSGVLAIFTSFYEQKQQKILESKVQQKKFNQVLKIINFINTKIIMIQSGHVIMGNKSFFETLGVKNLKEFYKKYEGDFSFMKGIECDGKKSNIKEISEWLNKIDESKKSFKTDIYNNKYKKDFTYNGRVTSLPDSEPVKYIISLNNISSHLEDEAHMRDRLEHDELTGLINYVRFEHLVGESQRVALEDKTKLALAIVDIPQLKEINGEQGMDIGDKTIINVANDIQSLALENMIIARLEGSRFGILMSYEFEQESYDWCSALHMKLSKKPERKTISLTACDLSETVNTVLMRSYNIIDSVNNSENGAVSTDFEDIKLYEALSNQKQFTDRLKDLKKIKTTLYHKGLAVVAEHKIIYTDRESITIMLSNKEFLIALEAEAIYLNIPSFGIVAAQIKSVNDRKMNVVLHKFRLNKDTPLSRTKFRVDVKEDIKVSILSDGLEFESLIIDMNEQYIALKLKRKRSLCEGSFVSIESMFPINDILKPFSTEATVQKIQRIENAYKIVLLCHLDSNNKSLLQQYIANRQMEIIKDLKKKEFVKDFSI